MILATGPSFEATLLGSAVVATVVSGIVVFALETRRARKDRQRQLFGEAFAAITAYREFPRKVRRRDKDKPAEERVRLSDALSDVQQDLDRYRALLRVEAPHVAAAYASLVIQTRRVAGAYIKDAWERPAAQTDGDVSTPDIDLSELDAVDNAYLHEVSDHLAALPRSLRRSWRSLRQ